MFNWLFNILIYSIPWWVYVVLFLIILSILYKAIGIKNSLYVLGTILTFGILQKQRQDGYKDGYKNHEDLVNKEANNLQDRYDEVDTNNNPNDAYDRLRNRSD